MPHKLNIGSALEVVGAGVFCWGVYRLAGFALALITIGVVLVVAAEFVYDGTDLDLGRKATEGKATEGKAKAPRLRLSRYVRLHRPRAPEGDPNTAIRYRGRQWGETTLTAERETAAAAGHRNGKS